MTPVGLLVDALAAWTGLFVVWTLEATLWSSVVLLVLAVGRRWSPHARAAVVHLGTLKLLATPWIVAGLGVKPLLAGAPEGSMPAAPDASVGAQGLLMAAVAVAGLGTAWILCDLLREARRLARLRRRARRWRDAPTEAGRFAVLIADRVPTPFAMGVLRPTIVLPAALIDRLDARQRAAVLAHEAAHLRAGDVVWTGLGTLLTALFWFHPLIRRLVRAGLAARELRCDDRLLARREVEPSTYARALIAAAAVAGERPMPLRGLPATAAVGQGLEARLERLAAAAVNRRACLGWPRLAALAIVALPLLTLAVFPSGSGRSERPDAAAAVAPRAEDAAEDHRTRHHREHRARHLRLHPH